MAPSVVRRPAGPSCGVLRSTVTVMTLDDRSLKVRGNLAPDGYQSEKDNFYSVGECISLIAPRGPSRHRGSSNAPLLHRGFHKRDTENFCSGMLKRWSQIYPYFISFFKCHRSVQRTTRRSARSQGQKCASVGG